MKIFLLLFLAYLSLSPAFSQSFVNGSFEIAKDSCLQNIPNEQISSIIPGLYSFGDSRGVDFVTKSCPLKNAINPPDAKDGRKYLVFGYDFDVNGSDSIALALTSPLIAGQKYKLNYYHRRDPGFTSPVYEVGYSKDSNTFGKLIALAHCTNFKYEWEDTSFTFTPTINCSYITLRNILNGEVLYIDDFTISSVSDVKEENQNYINSFPNPFDEFTTVQLPNVNLPLEIQVSDVTGKTVYNRKNITETEIKIYKGDFHSGVYMLKISDSKMNSYYTKLAIQ